MLTKEECLEALSRMIKSHLNGVLYGEDTKILKQLINEHFDNPPLKFEDLKENMWVWDNYCKEYCYIYFVAGKYPHIAYIDGEEDGAFKENRFYRREVEE